MVRKRLVPAVMIAFLLSAAPILDSPVRAETAKKSLGIYLYENIEGYHTVSSTANTRFATSLLPVFARITTYDKVPLESNETVRILDEMTKDRKVVITTLTTWITGNVIAAPTVTFADDAIKFKDLTWHVDENKLMADAEEKELEYVLTGSFSGMVKKPGEDGSEVKKRLVSVTVISNMKLVNLKDDSIVWAGDFTEVAAGFDPRVAFNDAVIMICDRAGEELNKKLTE